MGDGGVDRGAGIFWLGIFGVLCLGAGATFQGTCDSHMCAWVAELPTSRLQDDSPRVCSANSYLRLVVTHLHVKVPRRND